MGRGPYNACGWNVRAGREDAFTEEADKEIGKFALAEISSV